ncbi:glycoside hydrolase family 2 protein [Flavihumibacter sp. ZG627]|uniref:glycoside hydrolase family 2 protein n=1 Tax=Flavihumibacter sp. ZG627 TaxID=1463156 RepID=UPI00057C473C|nr:sugar-binding domain-containing protein [Flavihumibacter sp. ZG627]KIC89256.1 beta-galactosidase [Flavihumibacter sp. ZG627]
MKRIVLAILNIVILFTAKGQEKYTRVEGKIMTPWADSIDLSAPLNEYPRPQMVRTQWLNLNGLWQYAVLPVNGSEAMPSSYDGNILVPFAIESALSGVGKTVGKDSVLWYKRTVSISPSQRRGRVLLHFGAVDWRTELFVNGKSAGIHEGGYDPFSFDITALLQKGTRQEIGVRVWDPTDDGVQPRGKQVKKPEGIWYTSVTGIWQTVWLEMVPETYIAATRQTPDLDKGVVRINARVESARPGDRIRVKSFGENKLVAEMEGSDAANVELAIPNVRVWSPEDPFLYQLSIAVIRNGKIIDEVKSYFAMRKISMVKDAQGIQRMMFNNKFLFQYGPLDQGWWPDGLYTAPTDAALRYDIEQTRAMGFNMIRKHVKVEPARWYYHCDQLGMLVWQDMPSGDMGARWESRPGVDGLGTEMNRTPESEKGFRKEWQAIMSSLHNFPSIVVWVPFNEAWGQFKTVELSEQTIQSDPSRLVNAASGGNFIETGHIIDLHNYPEPAMPRADLFGAKQILVLGEFGGLGLPVENHSWQDKNNWGYQSFKDNQQLLDRYTVFMNRFPELIKKGLSAAVYTQTTDVEVEVNGLMTYDRKKIKMPVDSLKKLHSTFIRMPSE